MSLIAFRLFGQEYAAPLAGVREVVRLEGLRPLPGAEPPLAGMIDVRGEALPVFDSRPESTRDDRADVLIMERDSHVIGIACDGVLGVLPDAEGAAPGGLPAYVASVLPQDVLPNAAGPVLLVDLWGLVTAMALPSEEHLAAALAAVAPLQRAAAESAAAPAGDEIPDLVHDHDEIADLVHGELGDAVPADDDVADVVGGSEDLPGEAGELEAELAQITAAEITAAGGDASRADGHGSSPDDPGSSGPGRHGSSDPDEDGGSAPYPHG